MAFKLARSTRLAIAISISFSFFLAEISVGFKTHSIALIADAFHYLNDLISFIVAFVAIVISEKGKTHKDLTFGWQRAQLLGAFFNGVFLLALGISIFLQSIERFISLQKMQDPMLVLIIGCIGLGLNLLSALFLHEHDHDHHPGEVPLQVVDEEATVSAIDTELVGPVQAHQEHRHYISTPQLSHHHHDFGMAGVLLHVAGDAFNNIGVIIAGAIVWKTSYPQRYYADPAVSMAIALMILLSALPLVKKTGHILLQSPPTGIDVADIKHDLETIPGVVSVHELHVWRLNQQKALASAHVVIEATSLEQFQNQAKTINECLHAYGVHSATIQPELASQSSELVRGAGGGEAGVDGGVCQMNCGSVCEKMKCCG